MLKLSSFSVMHARVAVFHVDPEERYTVSSLVEGVLGYLGHPSVLVPVVIDASANPMGFFDLEHDLLSDAMRRVNLFLVGWYFGNHQSIDDIKWRVHHAGTVVFSSLSAIEIKEATETHDKPDYVDVVSDDDIVFEGTLRSGQQLKSHANVTVIGRVHSGSEVHAGGSVNIQGYCGGSIFVGMDGDESASIQCDQFDASLISIAGMYQLPESFPDDVIGKPVTIALKENRFLWSIRILDK